MIWFGRYVKGTRFSYCFENENVLKKIYKNCFCTFIATFETLMTKLIFNSTNMHRGLIFLCAIIWTKKWEVIRYMGIVWWLPLYAHRTCPHVTISLKTHIGPASLYLIYSKCWSKQIIWTFYSLYYRRGASIKGVNTDFWVCFLSPQDGGHLKYFYSLLKRNFIVSVVWGCTSIILKLFNNHHFFQLSSLFCNRTYSILTSMNLVTYSFNLTIYACSVLKLYFKAVCVLLYQCHVYQ